MASKPVAKMMMSNAYSFALVLMPVGRDPLDRRLRDVDQLDIVAVIDLVIEGLERQAARAKTVVLRDQLFRDGLVLDALADFSRDEIGDRRVRLAVDQDVLEVALPDAEAALAIEFFVERLALLVGDFERAARIGRVEEAGESFLAAREHLGIAGLDRRLRLGVDLAVMQRRAPVRRALEYGEMADFAGDGLDGLHAGGAGADHGDALALEVDRLFRPARGVERASLETVAALDARQGRRRQRADRRDQEARREAAAVVQRNAPASRRLVIDGRGDAAGKLDVAAQVELVGDIFAVAQRLRLAGEMLRPFPFRQQFLRERVAVGIAFGIEARAGIAVPVPGAADLGAGLEHAHPQAELAQPVELVHARQPGADDDGVEVEGRIRAGRRGGHVGYRVMLGPKLSGLWSMDKPRTHTCHGGSCRCVPSPQPSAIVATYSYR